MRWKMHQTCNCGITKDRVDVAWGMLIRSAADADHHLGLTLGLTLGADLGADLGFLRDGGVLEGRRGS